jgi:CHAT domain-containing protein
MNATSPMYSRLVLSKDSAGADAEGDGYLHAYEIYELDLRAQLAVLTACETGTGKDDGEGVRSLGYGFAYAGCPSLVTSLWSIDEQISSAIIKRFYELLADGLPKHLAMRQAKLDHLASVEGELALPYYWAGLVLVGDVEPVRMPFSWSHAAFLECVGATGPGTWGLVVPSPT